MTQISKYESAARAPQTTDELVAEVKAALANPLSKHAPDFVLNYRAWLGALVQAVEDQQREINCEVFVACDGQKRRINGGHVFKFDGSPCDLCHPSVEVAQLRADGQRLRDIAPQVLDALGTGVHFCERESWGDVAARIRAVAKAFQAALSSGDAP